MELSQLISKIDQLKEEIEAVRPLSPEVEQRIMQKFRLDWNYHSNAIEGNSLTYGETRAFLMQGVTAKGKPFKDHLDIEGHDEAISYLEAFIKGKESLSQKMIKELHKILLVRPYSSDTVTSEGIPAKRTIQIGQYKQSPNHVKTKTGKIHYYASPEETPAKMSDLVTWYRKNENKLHPLILAATLHYQFVAIHPFDDGNGRMARLLMNLVLMNKGYIPVVLPTEKKTSTYFPALEKADAGEMEDFIELIGEELIRSMELYLKGARGESIEELSDLDKKLALLERRIQIDQVIKHKEKSPELFANIVNSFLLPFFEKLLPNLSKFDKLFEYFSHEIKVHYREHDGYLFENSLDIESLKRVLRNPETYRLSDLFVLEFNWYRLINYKDVEIRVHICFNLERYFISSRLIVFPNNKEELFEEAHPEEAVLPNIYYDINNENLVNNLSFSIPKIIYKVLEKRI